MKQIIILLSFFSCISLNVIAQSDSIQNKPIEIHLIFKSGKTKITKVHKKQLEDIQTELSNGKEVWIYPVVAYSSRSKKSSATNLRQEGRSRNTWFDPISRNQANSIIRYLQNKNFNNISLENNFRYSLPGPAVRVKVLINDESKPIGNSVKQEKIRTEEEQIPLNEYFPEKKSQFFIVDPQKDTLIEGEEGTKLFIASGSLLCDEPVQIELKEYYKAADFLKADLQTVSNGKLLFTGGTIYLDARKKSDLKTQVKINPSRGINAEFTEGKNDPEMKLFLKDKTSAETNWILQRKRRWRYTRNYMLNKEEKYKTVVFNSPNEYQEFVMSGEAKRVEEEWYSVLRAIALEKWNAERKAELEKQRIEQEKRDTELARERKNDEAVISRLTINELGLINADKFVDTITEEFEMMADNSRNATYYLVFEGVNKGILKGSGSEKINFGSIPVDQPMTIIGISITEKEKHIFKKRINSMRQEVGEVVLAKADDSEINSVLDSINN